MTNSNDLKYKKYKSEKTLKYLVIFLSFLTIILESFALFGMISYLWGLIPFVLTYLVKYIFVKQYNKNKDDHKKK